MHIIHNGTLVPGDWLKISHSNKSFRYGIGCFETMRLKGNEIPLFYWHWQRLSAGIKALQFKLLKPFSEALLLSQIKQLCDINNCELSARIRITLYANTSLLSDDNFADYIIEAFPSNAFSDSSDEAIRMDVFYNNKKAVDSFSNLKISNYLHNSMAVLFAKQNNLQDMFVVNSFNEIIETTTSNIIVVKDGILFTPRLESGPVNGVMLQWLKANRNIKELTITESMLLEADEIILTNGMGIKRVTMFRDKVFSSDVIYKDLWKLVAAKLFR